MEYPSRRPRHPDGRRLALTINLTPEIHRELEAIGKGNRSAAVEMLVQWYLRRHDATPVNPTLPT